MWLPTITELTEVITEKIHVEGTKRQSIQIRVEIRPGLPDHFRERTEQSEVDRLERLALLSSDARSYEIGRVPVRYDDDSW